jgi:hypothetical protein
MNPYSHLVLASRLQAELQPSNPAEYFWGTVAPDIRYTARLPRAQTHLGAEQILAWRAQYPEMESFIQGYLIHCLADEVELWALLEKRWYLRPFVRRISLKLAPLVLESYLVEKVRVSVNISGQINPILTGLGVDDPGLRPFRAVVERLINQPNFDSVLHLFRTLGSNHPKLLRAIDTAEKYHPYRAILYTLTKPPALLDAVEMFVRRQAAFQEIKRSPQVESASIQ